MAKVYNKRVRLNVFKKRRIIEKHLANIRKRLDK